MPTRVNRAHDAGDVRAAATAVQVEAHTGLHQAGARRDLALDPHPRTQQPARVAGLLHHGQRRRCRQAPALVHQLQLRLDGPVRHDGEGLAISAEANRLSLLAGAAEAERGHGVAMTAAKRPNPPQLLGFT